MIESDCISNTNNDCICSICMDKENILSCITCNFCIEGIICSSCIDNYENNEYYTKCPICRSLYIEYTKRNIIISALLYSDGIKNIKIKLIERWFNNYLQTDEYKLMGQALH